MTAEALYLELAKLGVTLAGFSGVVAGLRFARESWAPQDAAGIKHIVEHALAASLIGLIASAMAASGFSGAAISRAVGGGLAVFLTVELGLQVRRMQRLRAGGSIPRMPAMWVLLWVAPVLALLIGVVLNLLLWNDQRLGLLGMTALLLFAGIQFLVFLEHFRRAIETKPEKGASSA